MRPVTLAALGLRTPPIAASPIDAMPLPPLDHQLRSARSAAAILSCCLAFACAEGQVDDNSSGDFETSGTAGDGDGDPVGDGDGEPTGDGDGEPTGDGDGEPPCTSIGCECDEGPDSCDDGLACVAGMCSSAACGNGTTETPAEECDDGNDLEGDGCDNNCTFTTIAAVHA